MAEIPGGEAHDSCPCSSGHGEGEGHASGAMPGMTPEAGTDYHDLHEGADLTAPSGDWVGEYDEDANIVRNNIARPASEVDAQDSADATMTPADWDDWYGDGAHEDVIDETAGDPTGVPPEYNNGHWVDENGFWVDPETGEPIMLAEGNPDPITEETSFWSLKQWWRFLCGYRGYTDEDGNRREYRATTPEKVVEAWGVDMEANPVANVVPGAVPVGQLAQGRVADALKTAATDVAAGKLFQFGGTVWKKVRGGYRSVGPAEAIDGLRRGQARELSDEALAELSERLARELTEEEAKQMWRLLPSQTHHIASNKGNRAREFRKLLERAGIDLGDAVNKMDLPGHSGRHTDAYHDWVQDQLEEAIGDKTGDAAKEAAEEALGKMRNALIEDPRLPYLQEGFPDCH